MGGSVRITHATSISHVGFELNISGKKFYLIQAFKIKQTPRKKVRNFTFDSVIGQLKQ